MQHALNLNADLLQVVQVVEELEEMRLLQPSGTLNLVNLAFAALQKVNFDSPNAYFFKLARITLLMQEFAQQNQVRVSFKGQVVREKPQLTKTNKKIINLRTSKKQT